MSEHPTHRAPSGAPSIPGYVIMREIGRGSSGVVYRARQLSVDRLVALKVMHASLGSNSRSIRRLQREARIAAHLAHPSLISAIDMGETGGQWWFAMELVDGPSLAERLDKGGRLMEPDALQLFVKLCGALQYASEKGVVHRDIKPANILLERPDFPRLVDLGLARIEDDPMLTRTGATLGTPHYISPEQARDPALADVRSDIWSLGATLYHAVCGRPPFAGRSTAEILSAVLYGKIPDPAELRPELSAGLVLVVRKCLSRDPDLRYFAPAELALDLGRVLENKAPQIRRGSLEPLDPTRPARSGARLGLALAALVASLVLILLWRGWDRKPTPEAAGSRAASVVPWPPLAQLEARLARGKGSLANAFADLEELRPSTPEREQGRLEALHGALKGRLQAALNDFWKVERKHMDALLEAREFEALERFIEHDLPHQLVERTGFTPASLPRALDRSSFLRREERERERLVQTRAAAQRAAAVALERYARRVLFPAFDRQRRQGDFEGLRSRLRSAHETLYAQAGVDLRGVDREALAEALEPIRLELVSRLAQLEEDWETLDGVTLLGAVQDLALGARRALDAGLAADAIERFALAFDELLARHQLEREALAQAPSHRSLDLFLNKLSELRDRADEIEQQKASKRLGVLDDEVEVFYKARDYEAAILFWQSHASDPELLALEAEAAVRLEEAQELLAFLRRAALGIKRRAGTRVSLAQGSIQVSGTILLAGDPWERGFRLLMSESSARDYLLRPSKVYAGELLDLREVERFAILGADLTRDLGLQLQRALFRYREADFEGAHELLESTALQAGDLILHDLGLRVARALGREQEVLQRRQRQADREVERLTGSDAETMDAKQRAVELGRLLRDYRDVLDAESEGLLLRVRARLLRVLPPSTLLDFRKRFAPHEVSFPQFGRVHMDFRFDDSEVGSWDRGEWNFTGDRAWLGRPVGTLEELERRPAPQLELQDPLRTSDSWVEVRVRFYQPKDSPPELLAISLLGFHAVFTGSTSTEEARVLTGTSDLVDVARRARAGEGREFAGFRIETEHEVRVRVSRGSGRITAWVDGLEVDIRSHRPPGDGLDSARLTLRSIEPLELREVVIDAARR